MEFFHSIQSKENKKGGNKPACNCNLYFIEKITAVKRLQLPDLFVFQFPEPW